MIAAEDLVMDQGVSGFLEFFRHQEVVDSPPDVPLSGVGKIGPPGIGICLVRIEVAESVNKARVQKLCEFMAFFIGETGVFPVCIRVFQVDFLMGNVKVAADDDGLVGPQIA